MKTEKRKTGILLVILFLIVFSTLSVKPLETNDSLTNKTNTTLENRSDDFNQTNQTNETIKAIENNQDNKTNETRNNSEYINIASLNNSKNKTIKNSSEINLSEKNISTEDNEISSSEQTKKFQETPEKNREKDSNQTPNKTKESEEKLEESEERESGKEIKTTLFKEGKREIEYETTENSNLKIYKTEEIKNINQKEVVISSNEHFSNPVRVYAELPHETEKEKIQIFWKNENKDITKNKEFNINYYDENNNNKIERISWIVPHLSEQIFEIKISEIKTNTTSETEKLNLNIINPEEGKNVTNPINTSFSVNYSDINNILCNISITNETNEDLVKANSTLKNIDISETNTGLSFKQNLADGSYDLKLFCWDKTKTNKTINASKTNRFNIDEGYSLSTDKEIYLVGEEVNVSVNANNDEDVVIRINKSNNIIKDNPVENSLAFSEDDLDGPGKYTVEAVFDNLNETTILKNNFWVINTSLTPSKTEIGMNEELQLNLNINPSIDELYNKISEITINCDNGESKKRTNSFEENFTCRYSEKGDYNPKLTIKISNREIPITSSETIVVKDTEPPKIDLLYPENSKVINKSKITFWFQAEDKDSKLKNCTFELYNYTSPIGGILDFSKQITDIKNGEKKSISLTDFKETDYSWHIYCCDEKSNCNDETDSDYKYSNDFAINFSNSENSSETATYSEHEKTDEIETLQKALDAFIEKMEDYDSEKIKAIESLEINKDLKHYQKRLNQIDRDLGKNIKFITPETKREERKKEILEELEEIKKKIPKNIEIKKSEEYIKNSVTKDLYEAIGHYVEAKNLNINQKKVEKLAELNKKLQNKISTSTKITQLKINYNQTQENKEITLVTKNIELQNKSYEKFLEYIPEELSEKEFEFKTEKEKLSKNIYEIEKENLQNNSLIYTFDGFIDPEKIKKTQTILFKYYSDDLSGITGFSILELNERDPIETLLFIIFAIIAIFAGYIGYQKISLYNWKKQPNVIRTLELLSKAKENLRFNNTNPAKEQYHKIREIYPLLPEGFKKHISKEIRKIRVGIDKRDIHDMVKEYEKAKDQNRIDDSKEFYKKIKSVYKRLPEKYQEKIYERMFKPKMDF